MSDTSSTSGNSSSSAGMGIVGPVLNLFDNIIGRANTRKQNARQREHEWQFWNANNNYNTPLNQRLRMEAAGFNPNLVYGHGSVANTSQLMKPSAPQPLEQTNFGESVQMGLQNFNDLRMKDAALDGMAKQRQVADADITLKDAQTLKSLSDSAKTEDERKRASEQFSYQLDALRESTRSTQLKNTEQEFRNAHLDENQRMAMTTALTNVKAANATMDLQAVQKAIQESELQLRKHGLSWSDPLAARMLIQAGVTPESVGKKVQQLPKTVQKQADAWYFKNPFNPQTWKR